MIESAQKHLEKAGIDGWLLFDFRKSNDLAWEFLKIPPEQHVSRRFFYWIPKKGTPIKIVHAVESHVLDMLPGEKRIYLKWQSLDQVLGEVLQAAKKIAMEYSPKCAIPYVSKVDAGTMELVLGHNVEVVSSAPILQYFTSVWTDEQIASHKAAAELLDQIANNTWKMIGAALTNGNQITEYDVQQWILHEVHKGNAEIDSPPLCSVGPNNANPHYSPGPKGSAVIRKGDFIQIDLWCKKGAPNAVCADISRVAVAGTPTLKQKEIFRIVRLAQKTATDFVDNRLRQGKIVKGFEADQACRKVIEDAGYGDFFIHRTGHNIHTEVHGPGAHLDSLETFDDRPLIPRTCYSVEPGIYLPHEFGLRLEYDILIHEWGLEVTGGIQDELVEIH